MKNIQIEVSHGTLDHGHTSLWFDTPAEAGTAIAEMAKRGETAFIVDEAAEPGRILAKRILEEIRAAAPRGCYHAKVHLSERLPLGGLSVVRIAHLTRIDDMPLSAVCVEDAQTRVQENSSSYELESMIAALIIERVDYLVNGWQAGWSSQ